MGLPLPRVIPDVGPGGPLVTAMGGINALANNMHLKDINKVHAQYAPMTTSAEAASKLAYANMMGPQFLAKIMGNDSALGNMSEDQKKAALQTIYQAGSGQSSGLNFLNQMPQGNNQFSGEGLPSTNSLSGWIADKLKNAFGHGQQGQAPNAFSTMAQRGMNPQVGNILQGIAHVESGGSHNPYGAIGKDTGRGDRAIGKYQIMSSNVPKWTQEALGQSMSPQQFMNSPEAQERVSAYMVNKQLSQGMRPEDIGSTWFTGKNLSQAGNVRDVNGTTPSQYVNKMNEGMQQDNGHTYAENTGIYKGIVGEGTESGKIRAKDIEELNNNVFNAQTNETTLNSINDILGSPEFEQIRNVPLAGHHELAYYAKEGTPQQQEMVGRYYTLTGNIIKNASRDFAGSFRKGEQSLLQGMKPGPSDTVDSGKGKAGMLTVLNKMLMERSRLTSQYMSKNHANKLEASEWADRKVDGEKIRKEAHDRLNPTVTIRNRNTGEKKTISVAEARKLGVPNV